MDILPCTVPFFNQNHRQTQETKPHKDRTQTSGNYAKERLETLHILPKDAAYSVKDTEKDTEKDVKDMAKGALKVCLKVLQVAQEIFRDSERKYRKCPKSLENRDKAEERMKHRFSSPCKGRTKPPKRSRESP